MSIVTPNHLYAAAARAFLDASIHVICDKPLTKSMQEARDLATHARRSGLVFALTHDYTGYTMVRQVRAMAREGKLCQIGVV